MTTSNLPANIANMLSGLEKSVEEVGESGPLYMKMTKAGEFVYGPEDIEVEQGSTWAANPMGFAHGWVAWGDKAHGTAGKMLGERMGKAGEPIFPEQELPPVEGKWNKAVAIQFRCMDGEDAGTQVLFKSNSAGGRKAYKALLSQIVAQAKSGSPDYVPVCRLGSTHYKHDEYGKIYNPDFIVSSWEGFDSESEADAPEPTPSGEEVEEEAPKRKRKKAKVEEAVDAEIVDDEEEEEDEAPTPPKRRRRRAA